MDYVLEKKRKHIFTYAAKYNIVYRISNSILILAS